jgi:hypothetical protein
MAAAAPATPWRRPPCEAYAVMCVECGLSGQPQTTPAAAGQLAVVHDRLHHGGHDVADAIAVPAICESCRRAPATHVTIWPGTPPFAICDGCSPASDDHVGHTDRTAAPARRAVVGDHLATEAAVDEALPRGQLAQPDGGGR